MANVIDVVARLRADHSDYMRKMAEAKKATQGLSDSATSAGGRMKSGFAIATGAVGILGTAMVGAATMIGKMGISVAMANEQAKISFTQMLGSAEAAGAYMKELQDFAAKTPFEFPQLRTAASRLLVVGTAAKDVIPLMTALGDATSAMGTGGEGIERATRALQQMQTKGKVTGEEMMQLSEAGIPGWVTLAAAIGKTVPETQKMAEQGKVSVQQLMDAIQNYSGPALGRVKGMMDEQSRTLGGMFSTLKDTITMQLGDFMAPVVDAVKAQLPAFTTAIGGALTAIGPSVQAMMTAIIPLLSSLMPVLQPLILAFASLFTSIVTAGVPVMQELAAGLQNVAPSLSDIGPMVGELLTALAPLVTVFLDLGLTLLPPVISGFGLFTDALGFLTPVITTLVPFMQALALAVGAYVLATKSMVAWAAISAGASTAWAAAQILAMGATGGLTGAVAALNLVFGITLSPIALVVAAIVGLIAVVVLMWKKFDWFQRGLKGIWNTIVSAVQVAINLLLGYWEFWINTFISGVNLIIKAWNKIPFTKKIEPLDKVNLQLDITAAKVDNVAKKMTKVTKIASAADFRKFEGWGGAGGTNNGTTTPTTTPGADTGGAKANPLQKLIDSLKTLATDKLKTATDMLEGLKKRATEFGNSVKTAIMSVYSFSNALTAMNDSRKAFTDAAADVAATEKAVQDALASRDMVAYTKAVADHTAAVTKMNAANAGQMTFMESLKAQADKAKDFSVLLNRLRAAGLNEAGIAQVLQAGADTGSQIATELLNGGSEAITNANGWYEALVQTSNDTATAMKDQFYATGISTGQALVDGIQEAVKSLNLKLSSKGLTKEQITKLKKNFGVDVEFKMEALKAVTATPMATGGIVKATSGGTLALLGEAGRNEAVIPLPSNGMIGGGNSYSITIETGVGDPHEIGRQLVKVLQDHEKRNGRLPIRTM